MKTLLGTALVQLGYVRLTLVLDAAHTAVAIRTLLLFKFQLTGLGGE